ncbi:acylphosphatase [Nesterenkonia xinjiangensis]|uniref:D-alanine-D-alanine ligase-like ATP-grasp enzyme/acylphosphatase n=1 Tax=Nesterenkonia xinjiangensis TaxID=225327 RepID=A0A7Z0KAV6_9MICC|nr:acylphosphatase [Nesterenkonia xinjiangensis]NYJ76987.1 D-alanine-D-alanine ligase-like ATP-grasp enzyme/acylphosphatase [Nesterenkonia xinjiangensis]
MTHSDATEVAGSPTAPEGTIRITFARALSYRVPRRRSSVRPSNIIFALGAVTADGSEIRGQGEGQPRGGRTGDDAGDSWAFAQTAVESLQGHTLAVATPADTLHAIRQSMARLRALASAQGRDGHTRPFRGTLLGLEVALLDLASRAHDLPLVDLLGRRRDAAPLAPTTVSPRADHQRVLDRLDGQRERYDHSRVTVPADVDEALAFLTDVTAANRAAGEEAADRPLWVTVARTLSSQEAHRLVGRLAREMSRGRLPSQLVLGQPVPSGDGDQLRSLQRRADRQTWLRRDRQVDLRIMGDGSMWDAADVVAGHGGRPLRAVNVRPAQAGGLLESIDLAEAVLRANPDATVALTRMVGASRLTTSALRHLALALPRIDSARLAAVVENHVEITTRVLDPEQAALAAAREAAADAQAEEAQAAAETASRRTEEQEADFGWEGAEEPIEDDALAEGADGDSAESEAAAETETAAESETAIGVGVAADVETDADAELESARRAARTDDEDDDTGPREGGHDVDDEVEEDDETEYEPEYDADDVLHQVVVPSVPGLGVDLAYENLVGVVVHYATYPTPPAPTLEGRPALTYDDVDYIRPMGSYAVHGHIVEREALAYGLNTRRFNKSTFQADDGERSPLSFRTARWPLSSVVAASIVRHKESTRILLHRNGCPVPLGRTFSNGDAGSALQYAERIGFPVVLKPAAGSMGVGVTANIVNAEELGSALDRMRQSVMGSGDFIVEKHIHGRDYRIMVLGDEVVAAVERVPASVVGDGTSTLIELILAKNAARKQNSHLATLKLKWNATARHESAKAGYQGDSVIPAGERVLLNSGNNLTQGGDSIEILDEIHPSILKASVEAVKAVPGLAYCGVDFLLEDHTRPLDEQEGAICELNAVAALPVAEYPMFGTPRRVSSQFLRRAAGEFGLHVLPERAERLSVRIRARGRVVGVGYRGWFSRRAAEFGCTGWIRRKSDRSVEAVVSGPTDAVAALATAAVLGPRRARPTSVTTVHVQDPGVEGFEIRKNPVAGQDASRSASARARRALSDPVRAARVLRDPARITSAVTRRAARLVRKGN